MLYVKNTKWACQSGKDIPILLKIRDSFMILKTDSQRLKIFTYKDISQS